MTIPICKFLLPLFSIMEVAGCGNESRLRETLYCFNAVEKIRRPMMTTSLGKIYEIGNSFHIEVFNIARATKSGTAPLIYFSLLQILNT